jgi:hypothetical protein
MEASSVSTGWWRAVKMMADLVSTGYDESELTEHYVREELMAAGFASQEVDLACEWVEKAIHSGTLYDSLMMLQQPMQGHRIANPLETVCFSDKIWSRLERCCERGLISRDLIERLLEGARVIDTRGWDDEEVANLLAEMLHAVNPTVSEADFLKMLKRGLPQFYC